MDYAEIMSEIIDNLSGDWKQDVAYLAEKIEQYKNGPHGVEVVREIGRLMYEIIPDEYRDEFNRVTQNMHYYQDAMLNQAEQLIREGKITKAERILRDIAPLEGMWESDSVTEYLSFDNDLEACFYEIKYNVKKRLCIPSYPYNRYYRLYVYILVEKGDYEKALGVIDEALRRGPLLVDVMFEKAEIYKLKKDMHNFLATTIQCLGLIYTRANMARYLRNIGYYFIEADRMEQAICAYIISGLWQESEMAQSQLFYIEQVTGRKIDFLSYIRRCDELLGNTNIPLMPDAEWCNVAWGLAEQAYDDQDYELARFCYSVVYELSENEKALEKISLCDELMSN